MSLIPTDSGSGATVTELPGLIRQWMKMQEEMATLNNELKQRKTQSKALKEIIIRIMETNNVANLSISKGTLVHSVRELAEPISNKYMLKQFKEFFNGDEARARALIEYLEENRSVTVKHDLKLKMSDGAASGGAGGGSSGGSR
jgi:hypothetical protein